jgi:prepilin-type N-terminal cleavage/methylation domain-containing protein
MSLQRKEGFTLLELIVVMALIGIVFFFAIPRFENTFILDDSKKSARWLTAKFHLMREEALRTHADQVLHLDFETNRVWQTSASMSAEQMDRAALQAQPIAGSARLAGVEYAQQGRISSGQAAIRFYGDGHSDRAILCLQHTETLSCFLLEPFLSEVKMFDHLVGFADLR